ncbi:unnamed protein product [Adineta steineri]|uniref:AIG1-type G domain-containing protein n=1 Tax=Adineta steineri TaxID=433720 RepID=A0A819XZD5_9BILA|nr:unnamed protein product [Adineta steineri]CAF4144332.1 unnamed protein product [Adineta steineri]
MGNHQSCPLLKIIEAYSGSIFPIWHSDQDYPTVGLILLGNTGVGKSFLANILLGENTFEHRFSTDSVTNTTEFKSFRASGRRYVVFDVPGLIECDEAAIERNKIQIQQAFEQRPNCIVAPVFSNGISGRLRNEDLVAFNALNNVYHFRPESLLFIINDLPTNYSSCYEEEAAVRLNHLLEMKSLKICFISRIDINSYWKRKQLRMKLLNDFDNRKPSTHRKTGEIVLPLNKIKQLEEEMRKKQDDFEAKRKELEKQIRWQKKMEGMRENDWCVIL